MSRYAIETLERGLSVLSVFGRDASEGGRTQLMSKVGSTVSDANSLLIFTRMPHASRPIGQDAQNSCAPLDFLADTLLLVDS